jgi:hypothetical protein
MMETYCIDDHKKMGVFFYVCIYVVPLFFQPIHRTKSGWSHQTQPPIEI